MIAPVRRSPPRTHLRSSERQEIPVQAPPTSILRLRYHLLHYDIPPFRASSTCIKLHPSAHSASHQPSSPTQNQQDTIQNP